MSSATLTLERTFDAPREAVFAAWTDPEILRRWWAMAPDWDTPEATVDLRVGGRYRLAMRDAGSGAVHVVGGEYRSVEPPERLVYTWTWEDGMSPGSVGSVVTVAFREDGGRTTVLLTHTGFVDADALPTHEHGWNGVLDNLEAKVLAAPRSGAA
jgi:uncharacterized protein YndB with AHSA1/START domain